MKRKNDNTQYIGKFLKKDYINFKDGLFELLDDYKRKSERLDKIIKQSDKMQLRLLEANEQLDEYKNNLEKKVEEEIKKREEKEKMLIEQSKFAAMGEMIDAIAHQWAQPLGILNLKLSMLDFDFQSSKIDEEYIKEFQEKATDIIEHMNTTLNEFRTFFRPNKEQKYFNVKEMIEKVFLFVKDEFIKFKIHTKLEILDDFELMGIENEFKHIILNIINNSKDAFVEKNLENREIFIKVYEENDEKIIEISDNAGGIDKSIINDIFKANFTTKKDKGSGIGLYMSYQIAKKNNTELTAKNIENGALFTLKKR
ncbi:sensor histidine kinase [Halarcobacter anaerophilus]|uniref:Histidine kinase n=1 Tax=Halarcobacter anaerophilus TaxID=877500 RepID=A0A4Q0XY24_9BACT|nr:HAMP domain-containing sensor histidine kinase [Halarcobacter anaerophilus]QDF28453.1 signal transduction sensor histidine kinase [Halarcobacter anaerophilus]RXJ61634.1 histidine kinase [Halarcobacter anaerophilus]